MEQAPIGWFDWPAVRFASPTTERQAEGLRINLPRRRTKRGCERNGGAPGLTGARLATNGTKGIAILARSYERSSWHFYWEQRARSNLWAQPPPNSPSFFDASFRNTPSQASLCSMKGFTYCAKGFPSSQRFFFKVRSKHSTILGHEGRRAGRSEDEDDVAACEVDGTGRWGETDGSLLCLRTPCTIELVLEGSSYSRFPGFLLLQHDILLS